MPFFFEPLNFYQRFEFEHSKIKPYAVSLMQWDALNEPFLSGKCVSQFGTS
jgi:hypothetical protein